MPGWLFWLPRSKAPGPIDPVEQELERLGIRHFDEDILAMKIEVLRRHFAYPTGTLKKALFFRNVVWQLYEQIQAGSPPDFYLKHGFIRGMWYHIKSRISRYKPLRGHFYGTMVKALTDMVKAGLCTYRDFNFRDRDQELRHVGSENPHVILFSEKDGFISILEDLYAVYGCSVTTLGGRPSFMSSNYLVAEMVDAGVNPAQEFFCFSVVDFDPAGYDAAGDFIAQLEASGLKTFHAFRQYEGNYTRLDLVQPKNLTGADIDLIKYRLPARVRRSKLCATWAANTGGVDGHASRTFGLESDEFTLERIQNLVTDAITPYLRTSAEVVQRRRRMRELEKAVTDFMVYKLLHQQKRLASSKLPDPIASASPDRPLSRASATRPVRRPQRSSRVTPARPTRRPRA